VQCKKKLLVRIPEICDSDARNLFIDRAGQYLATSPSFEVEAMEVCLSRDPTILRYLHILSTYRRTQSQFLKDSVPFV
jgi:hypothetical protein